MEFKVGERYKIVDIDAWWDKEAYINNMEIEDIYGVTMTHQNGDKLTVELYEGYLRFINDNGSESQDIESLMDDEEWHDSCVELIEEQGE